MARFRVVERRFGPDYVVEDVVVWAKTRRAKGAQNELAAAVESTRRHAESHASPGSRVTEGPIGNAVHAVVVVDSSGEVERGFLFTIESQHPSGQVDLDGPESEGVP